jgi:hypothetical protein
MQQQPLIALSRSIYGIHTAFEYRRDRQPRSEAKKTWLSLPYVHKLTSHRTPRQRGMQDTISWAGVGTTSWRSR